MLLDFEGFASVVSAIAAIEIVSIIRKAHFTPELRSFEQFSQLAACWQTDGLLVPFAKEYAAMPDQMNLLASTPAERHSLTNINGRVPARRLSIIHEAQVQRHSRRKDRAQPG